MEKFRLEIVLFHKVLLNR